MSDDKRSGLVVEVWVVLDKCVGFFMTCDFDHIAPTGGLVLAKDGPCQVDALRRFINCFHGRYLVRVFHYAVNTLVLCKARPMKKTIATTEV